MGRTCSPVLCLWAPVPNGPCPGPMDCPTHQKAPPPAPITEASQYLGRSRPGGCCKHFGSSEETEAQQGQVTTPSHPEMDGPGAHDAYTPGG